MEEAAAIARLTGGDRVTVDADRNLTILGDADALHRVLLNLLDNALRHGGREGPVVLRSRSDDGKTALVEVEDHGPGIPFEQREAIFERFYRGDPARAYSGGAGLGLPISAALVARMGGTIEVESQVGRGSTFRVRLRQAPAAGPEASVEGPIAAAVVASRPGRRGPRPRRGAD
jgi:two-component system OmpR family sensor kinase